MFKHQLRAATHEQVMALKTHISTPVPEGLTARKAYMAKCAKIINSWGYLKAKLIRGESNGGDSTWFCEVNDPAHEDFATRRMFGKSLVKAGVQQMCSGWVGPATIVPGWEWNDPARVQETAWCQPPSAHSDERGVAWLLDAHVEIGCQMMSLVTDPADAFRQLTSAATARCAPGGPPTEQRYGWDAISVVLRNERYPSQAKFKRWYNARRGGLPWEELIPLAARIEGPDMRQCYRIYLELLERLGTQPWPRYVQRSDTWSTAPHNCHPMSLARMLDGHGRGLGSADSATEKAIWWVQHLAGGWHAGDLLHELIMDYDGYKWEHLLALSPRQFAALLLLTWIASSDHANPVAWNILDWAMGYISEHNVLHESSLKTLRRYLLEDAVVATNTRLLGKGRPPTGRTPAAALSVVVARHAEHWGRVEPDLQRVIDAYCK